jgi:hypothetical protein
MNGNNISPGSLYSAVYDCGEGGSVHRGPSYVLLVDGESDKPGRDGESLVLRALSILEFLCFGVICNVTTAATGVG